MSIRLQKYFLSAALIRINQLIKTNSYNQKKTIFNSRTSCKLILVSEIDSKNCFKSQVKSHSCEVMPNTLILFKFGITLASIGVAVLHRSDSQVYPNVLDILQGNGATR